MALTHVISCHIMSRGWHRLLSEKEMQPRRTHNPNARADGSARGRRRIHQYKVSGTHLSVRCSLLKSLHCTVFCFFSLHFTFSSIGWRMRSEEKKRKQMWCWIEERRGERKKRNGYRLTEMVWFHPIRSWKYSKVKGSKGERRGM